MRIPSENWLKDLGISRGRWTVAGDVNSESPFYNFPIFPWITPLVHPELRSLFERLGVVRHFKANEQIRLSPDNKVENIALLVSGVTARHFGSTSAQSRLSIAISVPGRFACGNLNFFTHRPCIGRYYAVVPSTVLSIEQKFLYDLSQKDPQLQYLLATQFELNNLSDRLGFGAHSLLSVKERLLMFYLSWSAVFGKLVQFEGEDWVEVPLPLRGRILEGIVLCSPTALEQVLKEIKEEKCFIVLKGGDRAMIRLSVLEPVHSWIRSSEEFNKNEARERLRKLLSLPF